MQESELFESLNYLNLEEIFEICNHFEIPYFILIEKSDGSFIKSKDKDRKSTVLNRVRHFLKTGKIPKATIYPNKVCSLEPMRTVTEATVLHYGQYDKKNPRLMKLLSRLTNGEFKDGFIARELMRDFFVTGKAPSLNEFGKAWISAKENYNKNHSEWAFLTDRANGKVKANWKSHRNKIAKQVLREVYSRSLHV